MNDNSVVLEADLQYAVRMVRSKCATVELAARTCGVDVEELRTRLASSAPGRSLQQQKLFEMFNR